MERKGSQDSCKLNYDIGLESWCTLKVRQCNYIVGFANWKQTASGDLYWQVCRKNICQIKSVYQITRYQGVLVKQWNPIWYSSCNWSNYSVKLTIIHYLSRNPSDFFTDQVGKLNGNVVGITTSASFKPLIVVLISAFSPGVELLLVDCFPR